MALPDRQQRRLVLLLAAASLACAPAPRSGEEVRVAEESAIILWDAASKTQHFIRRASFETKAKDFGFLVPTPTVPKLAEADNAAFDHLARLTAPPVRQLSPEAKSEAPKAAAAAPAAPAVTVIATAKVAGYDAAVLEANDANALDRWLKQHGYASSPELVEWYKPYIAKKWKITAFKIAKGDGSGAKIDAEAVRMSFQTDQPFFPYREPAGAKSGDTRMLRIFLVADARYAGAIGAAGAWPGRPVWSNKIAGDERAELLKLLKLPDGTAANATRLTEFEDDSSPRPGTDDLFLAPAADQSALEKSPVYVRRSKGISGGMLILLAAAAIALLVWLVRRLRRDPTSAPPSA